MNSPVNETAFIYIEQFHVLCQYLWYTHLKLTMQQYMQMVNPFQPIYRKSDQQRSTNTNQRDQQLLQMAKTAFELLKFSDLHNKVTLQGSLFTILSLIRDPKHIAEIVSQIDENDVVIALRRRFDLLKERCKYVYNFKFHSFRQMNDIIPFESQYWTFMSTIIDLLSSDKIRHALHKDNLGAIGTEKFAIVARSIRKMSLKKIPLMLTPNTLTESPTILSSPTFEKRKRIISKMPSLKAIIGLTKRKSTELQKNAPKREIAKQHSPPKPQVIFFHTIVH